MSGHEKGRAFGREQSGTVRGRLDGALSAIMLFKEDDIIYICRCTNHHGLEQRPFMNSSAELW